MAIPTINLQYLIHTQRARQNILRLEAQIRSLNQQIYQLQRSYRRMAAVNSVLNQAIVDMERELHDMRRRHGVTWLRRLRLVRWELITLMFFMRQLVRVSRQMWQTVLEGGEQQFAAEGGYALARAYEVNMASIVETMREGSGDTITALEAIGIAQKALLIDHGYFSNEYRRLWESATLAAFVSGKEASEIFQAFIKDLVEGSGKATDAAVSIFELEYALQQAAMAAGTTVDELSDYTKEQVILNRIQEETNVLIATGAKEALENASGTRKMAASWKRLGQDISAAFRDTDETMEAFGKTLEFVGDAFVLLSATYRGLQSAGFFEMLLYGGTGFATWYSEMLERGGLTKVAGPEFARVMREARRRRGLEETPEGDQDRPNVAAAEKAMRDRQRRLSAIVDHIMKREDLLDQHRKRMDKIREGYWDKRVKAWRNFYDSVAKIRRRADLEEARARRRARRAAEDDLKRHQMKMRHYLEDHLRRMAQEEARFRLDQANKEALYQYERGLLVAEGDVLGIEDLDARHALEQDSDRKGHDLRQKQRQDDFDEEQRQREEAFKQSIRELRDHLEEQLREIREREAERILEAEIRRTEELAAAKEWFEEQKADQIEAHEESLTDWNMYWDDLAERTGMGAKEVTSVIRHYFGVGGVADKIMEDYHRRNQMRMEITRRLTGGSQAKTSRQSDDDPWVWRHKFLGSEQYGGSGFTTSPGYLRLHAGERYNVQPMSSIGGHMSVGWSGGAIPITGSGLEGADMSGVGDAIAQGIVSSLRAKLLGGA